MPNEDRAKTPPDADELEVEFEPEDNPLFSDEEAEDDEDSYRDDEEDAEQVELDLDDLTAMEGPDA
jgi:hypothetical protein